MTNENGEEAVTLIISTALDVATDHVVRELAALGTPWFRLDVERFPYESALTFHMAHGAPAWSLKHNGVELNSWDVGGVWYRRIRQPTCPVYTTPELHEYVVGESLWALRGALECLPEDLRWMSRPQVLEPAENKLFQLKVARGLGWVVPSTLISNSPPAIRAFLDEHPRSVLKPVRSGYLETPDGAYAMYTRRAAPEDLELLDAALPCPVIVQEEIPKAFDIRVTVVGTTVFAARIHSQGNPDAVVDWRRTSDSALPHSPVKLPVTVERRCVRLCEVLGLAFGAIDLVEDESGDYHFLEVNPSGQWIWIEEQLGFPISQHVARWLRGL